MGRAEELFNRIRDGGAVEVHRMICDTVVEELFLDYKRSSTTLPGVKLSEDDRKNLAKAIAGFANSEGGVVVWGVDCRHTENGDIPTGPVPVAYPVALKTLFDGALGGLTLPAHSGVENLPLRNTNKDDGFVVTYIPAGLQVPYQTLYPKQEYYIRAGSNFLPTPHGVLAGLFGRAPQPHPMPIVRFKSVKSRGRSMQLTLDVSVTNTGRGLAEDIFCVVDAKWPLAEAVRYLDACSHDRQRSWRTMVDGRDCFTFVLGDMTLPPGTEELVFHISVDVYNARLGDYTFTVCFGCKAGPGAAESIVLSGRLIDNAFVYYTGSDGGKVAVENERQEHFFREALASCIRRKP
jgi:hypothetical protein